MPKGRKNPVPIDLFSGPNPALTIWLSHTAKQTIPQPEKTREWIEGYTSPRSFGVVVGTGELGACRMEASSQNWIHAEYTERRSW